MEKEAFRVTVRPYSFQVIVHPFKDGYKTISISFNYSSKVGEIRRLLEKYGLTPTREYVDGYGYYKLVYRRVPNKKANEVIGILKSINNREQYFKLVGRSQTRVMVSA